MDILELIEDTVEVDAKTFGLEVLEKVAKLNVTKEQMEEFEELVEYWTERMEDDVENLLDMIACEDGCDCGCEDECDCGCEHEHCKCEENNEHKHSDCKEEKVCKVCGKSDCKCGCLEGKPCTCKKEENK